ncbi:MAG TPA: hypothetical protein VN905_10660 [Candidatus Binatia bacterium]|nr:hypothetical protein [Candidatus Binatia bacterium]
MPLIVLRIFAILAVFGSFAGAARAQEPTHPAMQPTHAAPAATHAPDPIHVEECNPRGGSPPTVAYVGPAFYGYAPVAPLGWRDVYGNYMTQPGVSPELSINYKNINPTKTAKSIEFGLVARGTLVAEVRDVGKFSPNITIKHTFGLSPNVFPLGTGLPLCVPLHVVYQDGTTWTSPHLPRLRASLGPH